MSATKSNHWITTYVRLIPDGTNTNYTLVTWSDHSDDMDPALTSDVHSRIRQLPQELRQDLTDYLNLLKGGTPGPASATSSLAINQMAPGNEEARVEGFATKLRQDKVWDKTADLIWEWDVRGATSCKAVIEEGPEGIAEALGLLGL